MRPAVTVRSNHAERRDAFGKRVIEIDHVLFERRQVLFFKILSSLGISLRNLFDTDIDE